MSKAGSRLQAPYVPNNQENPYLKPLPPQVDPFGTRGRFQQANLGAYSAENRTRVPSQTTIVKEEKYVPGEHPASSEQTTTTTTTVVED